MSDDSHSHPGRRSLGQPGSWTALPVALLALVACQSSGSPPGPVHVWLTTPGGAAHLSRQADLHTTAGGDPDISFEETALLQSIDGFGAAFTDSSASLLWNGLSPAARDAAMRELFS